MAGSAGKQYVVVQATHHSDGSATPIAIMYPGSRVFHITGSMLLDGAKDRPQEIRIYRVLIGKSVTKLYQEGERWYVLSRQGV